MWLYVLAIGAIIVIVIRGLMQRSDPTKAYILKPVTWLDLKHKVRYDVEEDYLNPNTEIKYDENTQKPYVMRKAGFMDKGDKRLPLTDYYVCDGNGFKVYLNHTNVISEWMADMIVRKDRQIVNLRNNLSISQNKVIQLESHIQKEFGKMIDVHKEMKEAAALIVKDKRR